MQMRKRQTFRQHPYKALRPLSPDRVRGKIQMSKQQTLLQRPGKARRPLMPN